MILGLTGQTGSGKSTVSLYLGEIGFYICDCDALAAAVRKEPSVMNSLASVFGGDILTQTGIDRRLLAERAFKNEDSVKKLNSIMHPAILERAKKDMDSALKKGFPGAVLDGAVLFESGGDKLCDFTAAVICPPEIRLERIRSRDSLSLKEAQSRMRIQHEDEFYTKRADYIIRNYPPFDYRQQIQRCLTDIKRLV